MLEAALGLSIVGIMGVIYVLTKLGDSFGYVANLEGRVDNLTFIVHKNREEIALLREKILDNPLFDHIADLSSETIKDIIENAIPETHE